MTLLSFRRVTPRGELWSRCSLLWQLDELDTETYSTSMETCSERFRVFEVQILTVLDISVTSLCFVQAENDTAPNKWFEAMAFQKMRKRQEKSSLCLSRHGWQILPTSFHGPLGINSGNHWADEVGQTRRNLHELQGAKNLRVRKWNLHISYVIIP